ncbi:hypothetical protein FH972_025966 [Carpinus fangiana]|uniref:Protein NO VEIN C-terminal domain-containing protein n=1 Tax=Carpinus fangiana TaxID=176857 RepID=A0A5N6L2N2_9ROSI|nr:hypothetical protein FH972_025966 [Carpinus fangiana]
MSPINVLHGLRQEEPITIEQANDVLLRIKVLKGGISDEYKDDMGQLRPEFRWLVEIMSQSLKMSEENFTRNMAEGLYSEKSRFLYELIQNADDANYSKVQGQAVPEDPWLSFTLQPRTPPDSTAELVIDTNENGFERENVFAICATGQSSKKKREGDASIGEKGFGFKSVFTVAESVHIQSGIWSFRFDVDEDVPLSMVTPLITKMRKLEQGIRTRIRLILKPESVQLALDELKGLPDTSILFLQSITKLTVNVTSPENPSETYFKTVSKKGLRSTPLLPNSFEKGFLTSHSNTDPTLGEKKCYRLFSAIYPDMPAEKRRARVKVAKVTLAFPFDEKNGHPTVSDGGESIFAFLPMKKQSLLPFLPQSDFITTTNREDVAVCEWNRTLLRHVSTTFVSAICQFCDEDKFRFRWPIYLPRGKLDGFWAPLTERIRDELSKRKILLSRRGSNLMTPKAVKILPDYFLSNNNRKPLFPDLPHSSTYLSNGYAKCGTETQLKSLGTKTLSISEIMDRIERNVIEGPTHLLQVTDWESDWQDEVALLMTEIWEHDRVVGSNYAPRTRLKTLDIIPLRDGSWVTPTGPIYFPEIDEEKLPRYLDLPILSSDACKTGDRRSFYETVGVRDCPPKNLVRAIKSWHRAMFFKGANAKDFFDHSYFLYRYCKDSRSAGLTSIFAITSNMNPTTHWNQLFFQSARQYDTQELVKCIDSSNFDKDIFLHSVYTTSARSGVYFFQRTWMQWLEQEASVRYYPKLVEDEGGLSDLLLGVLKSSSKIFLGALQHHWRASYEGEFAKSTTIQSILQGIQVSTNREELYSISNTYFPSQELLQISKKLGVSSKMPFIQLPESPVGSEHWDFLGKLGVRFHVDINFYLAVLLAFKTNRDLDLASIEEVYTKIGDMAKRSSDVYLTANFEAKSLVCNPRDTSDWQTPSKCVWEGPDFFRNTISLKKTFGHSEAMKNLFKNMLHIRNAGFEDLLSELKAIKADERWKLSDSERTWTMADVYSALFNGTSSPKQYETLSQSECIWNCDISLPGKAKMGHLYPDLKSFFVDRLQVSTANVVTLVGILIRLVDNINDVGVLEDETTMDLKAVLIQIGTMLPAEESSERLTLAMQELARAQFLPVRNASASGRSSQKYISANFFIVDHERYGEAFKTRIDTLDFSIEECRILHPLITRLGLQNRYLSTNVSEESGLPKKYREHQQKTTEIRLRSYALSCPHYFSQEQWMNDRLLKATVYTSDDLQSSLKLEPSFGTDRQVIKIKSKVIVPKIDNISGSEGVRIFLPSNEKELDRCYRSQIPDLMFKLLDAKGEKASRCLYRLLNEPNFTLYQILEAEDIPFLGWLQKIDLPQQVSAEELSTPTPVRSRESENLVIGSEDDARSPPRPYNFGNRSRSPAPFIFGSTSSLGGTPQPPAAQDVTDEYLRLLRSIMRQAFETLLEQNLPDFTRNQWQSTIRHLVNRVEGYRDLAKWGGDDQDIVYLDKTGNLGSWLREHNHRSIPNFPRPAPGGIRFWIEVKSTIGPCSNPVFMSSAQYRRRAIIRSKSPSEEGRGEDGRRTEVGILSSPFYYAMSVV